VARITRGGQQLVSKGRVFEGQRLIEPKKAERSGVYCYTAVLGPNSRDRKRKKFKGTKEQTRQDAQTWFLEVTRPLPSSAEIDLRGRQEQPLSLYLTLWLEGRRGALKKNTYDRYRSCIERSLIPSLGDVRLCDLSTQHIRSYMSACGQEPSSRKPGQKLSNKTIRNRLGVLSAALFDAMAECPPLLDRDPIGPLRGRGRRKGALPRVSRGLTYVVGPAEAALMLRAVEGSYLAPICTLALDTGARLGELLALRWRDVDLTRSVVTFSRALIEAETSGVDWYTWDTTKGGKGHSVDMTDATVEMLKRHRAAQAAERLKFGEAWQDMGLVFPNVWQRRKVAPGTPLRPSTVSRTFRARADGAGLSEMRFHDLRHACATIALQQGTPAHVVQRRLGHSDVETTLRIYSHVLPGQQKDAAEASWAAVQAAMGGL
jgi:integrase